ncbi:MAG: hypothetical protein AB1558_10590 [Thermodesulfobacteriota bacterium]
MSLVGKIVDTLCSRCGLRLAHTVLYEVGGAVHGVKCRTCGSEHRYHGPKPERRHGFPPQRRPGAESQKPRQPVRPADARQWELKNASTGPDAVIWDYRWTEDYEKGDVIDHPQFGRGFVEKKFADRMEVLFREGRKQMAINRRPANTDEEPS